MSRKTVFLFAVLVLALFIAARGPVAPADPQEVHGKNSHPGGAPPHHGPPPQASARMAYNVGSCVRFLSVFVPAQGGHYVLGLSFYYMDVNHDGHYTPGIDKMQVCVNCRDACGWGP